MAQQSSDMSVTQSAKSNDENTRDRPTTPFERMGGVEVIERIVNDFYDRMDRDPVYAQLRAIHSPDLTPMRASLAGFLIGWSGGPRFWFEQRPGTCVMSLHRGMPAAITRSLADQWLGAMSQAIDAQLDDPSLAEAMKAALTRMSLGMIRE